jgi:hypothetical protein
MLTFPLLHEFDSRSAHVGGGIAGNLARLLESLGARQEMPLLLGNHGDARKPPLRVRQPAQQERQPFERAADKLANRSRSLKSHTNPRMLRRNGVAQLS